mmetsp:Transcript_29083/g.73691  ORF Transcript_29083/g.73691 Transcript_29083/m.73691 type:complete len:80 (+) Transcript_29083:377-616(+)
MRALRSQVDGDGWVVDGIDPNHPLLQHRDEHEDRLFPDRSKQREEKRKEKNLRLRIAQGKLQLGEAEGEHDESRRDFVF